MRREIPERNSREENREENRKKKGRSDVHRPESKVKALRK